MEKYTYDDLCGIMSRLIGEGGCPWDREQTHESLRAAIIEEVYEFVDAVDQKDAQGMCEELGDILMLTVFNGNLAEKNGSFTNSDVIDGICRKMIARHSHVFGSDKAASAEEALITWDKNKYTEKEYKSAADTLRSVPRAFPALLRAQKVQSRAEKSGVDTGASEDAQTRLISAIRALETIDMTNEQEKTEKVGEALWEIADFSRIIKINADFALTNAVETFINRFEALENDLKIKDKAKNQKQ